MVMHSCDLPGKFGGCGIAIGGGQEIENGEMWVGNGEYCSQVNFCPNCGYKAKAQIKKEDDGKFERDVCI